LRVTRFAGVMLVCAGLVRIGRNSSARPAEAARLLKGVCLYTLHHSFITQVVTDAMTTLDVARLCGRCVGMIEKHFGHLVASSARQRLAGVTMLKEALR